MRPFIIISLLSFALADEIFETPKVDKCHALAFSSGDENSAYQAGALKGITTSPKFQPSEYAYDTVSGISGGALNSVILANFSKGQEQAAADRMKAFWDSAAHSKLYKDWLGGIARGLLFEGGLYNSAPMEDFLKSSYSDVKFPLERGLDMGIVNIQNGKYVDFDEHNITLGDNLYDTLFASMSFAGYFPPANVLGSYWFDGSAVWDIDIFTAINKCKEKGFSNQNIVVDVIQTSGANLRDVKAEDYKSVQMLFRYREIASFYNTMDGLLRAQFAYKGIKFRCIITPSGSIPSSLFPLDLNQKQIDKAFEMGLTDAQNAINGTSSDDDLKCVENTDNLIHYYALKKAGDERIMKHTYGSFVEAKRNGEFEKYDIYEDDLMRKYTTLSE